MEPIFMYFIKAGLLIFLFLTAYYFLLRKETFFKSNRWFLLFGLVISVVLPVVTFKKTVWIEPTPVVVSAPAVGYEWQPAPAEAVATIAPEETFEINWFLVTLAIYGIGILALLVKFALDFYALKKVLKGKQIHQQEDYKFVNVKENIAPFSYFNYIVYNPELYSEVEMQNILEHEKVHCSQNHTIDVLIARLFCIAFWWNPFVWFYKKAIVQNLEFIADSDAFKNISDKKAYQFTLLKITTHESCVAISNHFFQSLIKKRIVMLNKNQSKRWNSWKYAIIIPALAVFMWQFQVKVVAQEKAANIITTADGDTVSGDLQEIIEMSWNKNTSDEEFENDVKAMKAEGAVMKFSKIKRNKKGEIIAIKISYKDNLGNEAVKQLSSNKPIEPILFIREIDKKGNGKVGFSENNSASTVAYVSSKTNDEIGYEANDDTHNVVSTYTNTTTITPPTPPTPPNVPNFPTPPSPPNVPAAPTPPSLPQTKQNEKAWAEFEKKMEEFAKEMTTGDMKKFTDEMEKYGEEVDKLSGENSEFDKQMKEFEKKMEKFEKEMALFNTQVQQEVRTETNKEREEAMKAREEAMKVREEARTQRNEEREKAEKERAKAQKAREKAQREREAAKKK